MPFFGPQRPVWGSFISTFGAISAWSIRRKLLFTVIPFVALMLGVTGYATKLVSGRYLNMALERTTKVLTMGQADAVAKLFERARQDIIFLSAVGDAPDDARRFLEVKSHTSPGVYREVAYVAVDGAARWLFVDSGREITRVDTEQAGRIGNSPLVAPSRIVNQQPGTAVLLDLSEAVYPPGMLPGASAGATWAVFRLVTPAVNPAGAVKGYWIVSVDARAARDILSLHNSPESPLAAFSRTAEKRYSFFFDDQGWILFQSGNVEERENPLATDVARAGLVGDHGMPGYPGAFRPSPANEAYWRMVVDVQGARQGLEFVDAEMDESSSVQNSYSLGYAPVLYRSAPDREPEVVGGVAYMDKTRVPLVMNYRIYDLLFVIFLVAVALSVVIVYVVSRVITKPMLNLAKAVEDMSASEQLKPLDIPCRDNESRTLKDSINHLVAAVLSQREELRVKDERIQDHLNRQPLDLGGGVPGQGASGAIEGVVGESPAMRELKWLIRKAASVDPDVLIVGETGTGKEVTAQAIHKLSRRASGPFISINCGALDENLLLDALFGHVKGAFSEAKTDRKGAFLAAQGGTLLLDEIGNASPKVQQALLRALSVRTIIPLGSDEEIPFDARVIAATNVDLRENSEGGAFREDLYYRLKVLTLRTPPLRERRDDIPLLADAFLKDSARVMNKPPATLSRGAWERIAAHDWPGNVRELKHCITRAVAMADSTIIQAEDLRFDALAGWRDTPPQARPPHDAEPLARPAPEQFAAPAARPAAGPKPQDAGTAQAEDAGAGLNERQRIGLAYLREHSVMSRSQYQAIVGRSVPSRTAQYDLRDLVERGIVVIKGKGPATRYHLAPER